MKILLTLFTLFVAINTNTVQEKLYMEYDMKMKSTGEYKGAIQVYYYNGNSLNLRVSEDGRTQGDIRLKDCDSISYSITGENSYMEMPDKHLSEYELEVIGKDTFNGFSCTKLKLATHTSGSFKTNIWVTDEVPSYEKYQNVFMNSINFARVTEALNKVGLKGIIVKTEYSGSGPSFTYEFKHAGTKDFNHEIFNIKETGTQTFPTTLEKMRKDKSISKKKYKAMKFAEMKAKEAAMKHAAEQAKIKANE